MSIPLLSGQTVSRIVLRPAGIAVLGPAGASATAESGLEVRQTPDVEAHMPKATMKPARVPAAHVPTPSGNPVVAPGTGFFGFPGLTHADQRLAGTGIYFNTQFSLEPPDQGLSVGNGYVLESVNTALRVYTRAGVPLMDPMALNQFFGVLPEIDRNTGVAGDFLSDPKSYYDAAAQRWFLTVLQIDPDGTRSHVLIAVSNSSSPLGAWTVYSLDATNDGQNGTPSHTGCPCFGDQPLIGADTYGFYVSTNEFPLNGPGFNGAQIYAVSKAALVANTAAAVVHFGNLPLAEDIAYSVQPATAPPGGAQEAANGGTEYFLSALEFTGKLDNRIAVWALTNTSSLNGMSPSPVLANVVISSQVYGFPPAAQQKPGPIPLGASLKEHLALIESNDDRMQQVVFAAGKLWSALNSVVQPKNGPARTGAAYFIVRPSWNSGKLSATLVKGDYVSVNQASVLFPSIGVNPAGQGVMAFTLVGSAYYPSAAFARMDVSGAGPVELAGPGAAPEDGFTGYSAYGGRVARWGDYSAAVADENGDIWFGVEYIPNLPRTSLANWGTFVGQVSPN